MTKTRNLSDLLDANGDVKLGNLDNVPASNDASALTTGTLPIARIADGDIALAKLSATGTKDATTFLRGDNTFAEAGGGKILQVVSAIDSTQRTTTSTSFVTASSTLTVNITPSSTSSKIYVLVNTTIGCTNSAVNTYGTIFRDSTDLGASSNKGLGIHYTNSGNRVNQAYIIVDSPSSTSQITYSFRVRATNGEVQFNWENTKASIVAMEIGA